MSSPNWHQQFAPITSIVSLAHVHRIRTLKLNCLPSTRSHLSSTTPYRLLQCCCYSFFSALVCTFCAPCVSAQTSVTSSWSITQCSCAHSMHTDVGDVESEHLLALVYAFCVQCASTLARTSVMSLCTLHIRTAARRRGALAPRGISAPH